MLLFSVVRRGSRFAGVLYVGGLVGLGRGWFLLMFEVVFAMKGEGVGVGRGEGRGVVVGRRGWSGRRRVFSWGV